MKLIGSKIVLTAVVLVIAFSTTGRTQDLQAKIEFCNDCHGLSGQGYRGYLSIPRLAGQLHEYIIDKLVNWSSVRGRDSAKADTTTVMAATSHAMTRPQIAAV